MESNLPVQSVDERPALWVGHVVLATHDVLRSSAFYLDLGLRQVHEPRASDGIAELEMRGGTHLVLVLDPQARTDGRGAPFDLMADDLDALHDSMEERGVDVSPIERGGHASFTFRDPDGYTVTVNDSHVSGVV
ncbi:MAG: VOC family protein [Actinomycetota bacterium]|nr:VOC family protein [Actinomycetota bacterium]